MCGGIKDKPGFAASYDLPMSTGNLLKIRHFKLKTSLTKFFLIIWQRGGLSRAAFKPSLARCNYVVHFVLLELLQDVPLFLRGHAMPGRPLF
jgi:hypothetical protein